jgi:pimeloyl-ACP methyl ester carboxylesterase
MSAALDNISERYNITGFDLVGYSGGGAIVTLLAAQRKDILTVRTVAGNLDIDTFSDIHDISRLQGSMNPAEHAAEITDVPQHHFVGAWDEVVTPIVFSSYAAAAGDRRCIRSTIVEEVDHENGWVNRWPGLLEMPVDCKNYRESLSGRQP